MRLLKKMLPAALGLLVLNPKGNIRQNIQEDLLKQARQELSQAYNIFSNVSDPELIEIAVLNIKVAEKRFDFLVREMKRQLDE
ncbi:MAG TPA: DUF2508 family protein [Syntrophomonadaceae bacterium]|nr:DUF2508 family protein [Syntrophomonadaceae bacterium]HPR93939.1 DUF2508 family protein [Syntrophomonadaceae bacterium]